MTQESLTFQEQLELVKRVEVWNYSFSIELTAKSKHQIEQFEGVLGGTIKLRLQRYTSNYWRNGTSNLDYSLEVALGELGLPRNYFFEDNRAKIGVSTSDSSASEEAIAFSEELKKLFHSLKEEKTQQSLTSIREYLAQ